MSSTPISAEDRAKLAEFLEPSRIVVVATIGRNGTLQLTPNWYWFDGETISISTTKNRVKYRNLSRDPRMLVCIYSEPRRRLRHGHRNRDDFRQRIDLADNSKDHRALRRPRSNRATARRDEDAGPRDTLADAGHRRVPLIGVRDAYCAVAPPSMMSGDPVMNEDSSDARNSAP